MRRCLESKERRGHTEHLMRAVAGVFLGRLSDQIPTARHNRAGSFLTLLFIARPLRRQFAPYATTASKMDASPQAGWLFSASLFAFDALHACRPRPSPPLQPCSGRPAPRRPTLADPP